MNDKVEPGSLAAAQEAPTMLAVCAYCKGEIGRVACEPGQEGDVSHGICPACFKAQTGREPGLAKVKG
jgi:hypothetical protein